MAEATPNKFIYIKKKSRPFEMKKKIVMGNMHQEVGTFGKHAPGLKYHACRVVGRHLFNPVQIPRHLKVLSAFGDACVCASDTELCIADGTKLLQ